MFPSGILDVKTLNSVKCTLSGTRYRSACAARESAVGLGGKSQIRGDE